MADQPTKQKVVIVEDVTPDAATLIKLTSLIRPAPMTRPDDDNKKDLTMPDMEAIAGELYEAYCKAVGGKAFNGDPLPDWKTFRADPKKAVQSEAWVAVARKAFHVCR